MIEDGEEVIILGSISLKKSLAHHKSLEDAAGLQNYSSIQEDMKDKMGQAKKSSNFPEGKYLRFFEAQSQFVFAKQWCCLT